MARHLLDSDVLIWLLRGRSDTREKVEGLIEQSANPLACSVLSILEIRVGVLKGEEKKTGILLDSLEAVPVDGLVAARAAGLIRGKPKQKNPKEWIDALIAATCLEQGFVLVTYNRRDYPYGQLSLYPL